MFMSLLDEITVRAIKDMIKTAMILNTNASLMIKGLLRLETFPPKPIKPLFMKYQLLSNLDKTAAIISPQSYEFYP